jgi:gluconate 5-dehydrogenase
MIKRRYGRIIKIASIAGLQGQRQRSVLRRVCGKQGRLMGLTRELAASLGRHDIRVNAIAPGFFHSRLSDSSIAQIEESHQQGDAARTRRHARRAEGRLRVPGVRCLRFYITGQTIIVDGGGTIATGFT